MNRKKQLFMILAVLNVTLLLSCQKNEPKKTSSSTIETRESIEKSTFSSTTSIQTMTSSETTATSDSSQSEQVEMEHLWNDVKATKLKDFMGVFGPALSQDYLAFYPGHNTNLYGIYLPDDILTTPPVIQVAVNKNPVSFSWSENGTGSADYNLVAVYSNMETGDYFERYVYLFTLHFGEPCVLVTSQNQAAPDGYLHARVTENQELQQAFTDIIYGQQPNQPVATKTPSYPPSIEKASQLLRQRDQNLDVTYLDFGEKKDDYGYFRLVKAVQTSATEGSGTMGYFKVYFDYTIEVATAEDLMLDSPSYN